MRHFSAECFLLGGAGATPLPISHAGLGVAGVLAEIRPHPVVSENFPCAQSRSHPCTRKVPHETQWPQFGVCLLRHVRHEFEKKKKKKKCSVTHEVHHRKKGEQCLVVSASSAQGAGRTLRRSFDIFVGVVCLAVATAGIVGRLKTLMKPWRSRSFQDDLARYHRSSPSLWGRGLRSLATKSVAVGGRCMLQRLRLFHRCQYLEGAAQYLPSPFGRS